MSSALPAGHDLGVAPPATDGPPPELNPSTYQWSVRLFTILRRLARVNIQLHDPDDMVHQAEIFLFNHFARFETFIPQYLIYRETGAYCRSVASGEFFVAGDPFSSYLLRVGAIPNARTDLLPLLAREILRGRKVVLFPEGGMVKDRRVLDASGAYSVYSRSAGSRRKHHTGAAVLALVVDAFKAAVRELERRGEHGRLADWAEALGLGDREALAAAAGRPTLLAPANITFFPLRIDDNLLRRGAELLNRGISRRMAEELLIEGNILLRDTDMDIRLGAGVAVDERWRWWERRLVARFLTNLESLEAVFALAPGRGKAAERVVAWSLRRHVPRLRDECMRRMYAGVSVHLSHLASRALMAAVEGGARDVPLGAFRRQIYLAVKALQREVDVPLHRSLRDPDAYGGLLGGRCAALDELLTTAQAARLLQLDAGGVSLLPKLRREHDFDAVRLENPLEVYANEVAPVGAVARALGIAREQARAIDAASLARLRFDDLVRSHAFDRARFSRPEHQSVNALETATADGAPFLLEPPVPRPLAVVMIHGFLASPAEMRPLGERLAAAGHVVVGARLRGHGTSPWDLRARTRADWVASVRAAVEVAAGLAPRVCLVGFSTGAAIALQLAAELPDRVDAVVAAAVPLRMRNRNLVLVPFVHGANRVMQRVRGDRDFLAFTPNAPENPDINYRHIPVRGAYELRLLVRETERCLGRVRCPVLVMQGDADPVVDPASARVVERGLDAARTTLRIVRSDLHGIVRRDVDGSHRAVLGWLAGLRLDAAPDD
ncbi:MAG: alpha/beta fold hydrolase [Ectothiorhodospiraceae bacterium]|nr:alpha/beta fold hydrolase [Chromatiales bacterium]MCP5154421.1 alpha/beta fold hydrolase [Ectothiorhodospiraceae bacterium]